MKDRRRTTPSILNSNGRKQQLPPGPYTVETSSIETIDNDRSNIHPGIIPPA